MGKTLKHCFSLCLTPGKEGKGTSTKGKGPVEGSPGKQSSWQLSTVQSHEDCRPQKLLRLSGQVQGTPTAHSASQLQNVQALRESQVFSLKHTVYANSLVAINYSYQGWLVRVAAKSIRSQPRLFLEAGRTEKASQSCGLSLFRPSIDRPLTKLYTVMPLAGR